MQININQEEAKVLLAGIRMYYANMKQCNEDMLEREYRENDREKYATLKTSCEQAEQYCADLRDKIKQHQMKFPLEEHDAKRQYCYGKDFGYEQANWNT